MELKIIDSQDKGEFDILMDGVSVKKRLQSINIDMKANAPTKVTLVYCPKSIEVVTSTGDLLKK